MAQTKEGALRIAAQKAGLTVEEYTERCSRGLKRCYKCNQWRPTSEFANDCSRYDGKSARCFECVRVKIRISTKGRPSPMKGKTFSSEIRKRMGRRPGFKSPRKGMPRTPEERTAIAKATLLTTPKGSSHYAWKNGASARNRNDRRKVDYKYWRDAVFKRDNYTCQKCGDSRGGNLRAHHLKPFSQHPELRFEVSNGITLCHTCHELEHYKPDSIRNLRKLKRGEKLWK